MCSEFNHSGSRTLRNTPQTIQKNTAFRRSFLLIFSSKQLAIGLCLKIKRFISAINIYCGWPNCVFFLRTRGCSTHIPKGWEGLIYGFLMQRCARSRRGNSTSVCRKTVPELINPPERCSMALTHWHVPLKLILCFFDASTTKVEKNLGIWQLVCDTTAKTNLTRFKAWNTYA